jgi:5-methyltetrahydrofolate corrinoid/iron sulfur protein methyltransferase
MEIAMRIIEKAMLNGVDLPRVYIDPVIIPCNVPDAGHHPGEVLETIRQVKLISDPPPKTTLGLSNVSQGTSERHLINRIYLVMCLAAGLDSAIVDPLDTELMDAVITAELLMNRSVYCDDFLRAHRK